MNDTTSSTASSTPLLPHHKLHAFGVARELLLAVLRCSIRDAKLRDEALRSAKSACLNCAEGAGRVTRADKGRAFAIARAEAVEAAAAVEIAALCGDTAAAPAAEVARLAVHGASSCHLRWHCACGTADPASDRAGGSERVVVPGAAPSTP